MIPPEQRARQQIDRLLEQADCFVCSAAEVDITAHHGIALREFPLNTGFGVPPPDYLLYVDGKAAGIINAKLADPRHCIFSRHETACLSCHAGDKPVARMIEPNESSRTRIPQQPR